MIARLQGTGIYFCLFRFKSCTWFSLLLTRKKLCLAVIHLFNRFACVTNFKQNQQISFYQAKNISFIETPDFSFELQGPRVEVKNVTVPLGRHCSVDNYDPNFKSFCAIESVIDSLTSGYSEFFPSCHHPASESHRMWVWKESHVSLKGDRAKKE